ncbi:unnamed protein product [Blepharisma stoltei]|uniref:Uncharacterized protein n=1 Tax=Blepharisma stoltei TaxID=1481888 RepID=A0AAU9K4T9_9CILI|nr:unnamed protein product [Blepharisma stoltei]
MEHNDDYKITQRTYSSFRNQTPSKKTSPFIKIRNEERLYWVSEGKEMYQALLEQRRYNSQIKALENRLNHLQKEEEKTSKIMNQAKKRAESLQMQREQRQSAIREKELWKQRHKQEIDLMRAKHWQEREEHKSNLESKIEKILQEKKEIVNKVKTNRSFSNFRSENRSERKSDNIFCTSPLSNRSNRSLSFKKLPEQQSHIKIKTKKAENERLLNKLRELEMKEKEMIENLKNAYNQQKEVFNELEKVAEESRKPIKLSDRFGTRKNSKYVFMRVSKEMMQKMMI